MLVVDVQEFPNFRTGTRYVGTARTGTHFTDGEFYISERHSVEGIQNRASSMMFYLKDVSFHIQIYMYMI